MIINQIDIIIEELKVEKNIKQANELVKIRGKILHKKVLTRSDCQVLDDHKINY